MKTMGSLTSEISTSKGMVSIKLNVTMHLYGASMHNLDNTKKNCMLINTL